MLQRPALRQSQRVTPDLLPIFKLVGIMLIIGLVFERLAPAERGQRLSAVLFNLAYAPVLLVATVYLVGWLSPITAPWIERWGALIKIPAITGIPGAILHGLIFFAIFDFFYYWWHRAQHEFPWLWVQHELHHSEQNLNVTTSLRHHWLEEPLRVFSVTLPMSLLFKLDPPSVGWVFTIFTFWGYFIHMNFKLPFGALTSWLGGPQYHRIHHSIEEQHYNRNYAAFFPIYDRLFGTQYLPKPGEWPKTGLTDRPVGNSISHALIGPFLAWGKLLTRKSTANRAS